MAISSTKIGMRLNDGDIEMANTYLGYPTSCKGCCSWQGPGKLGFPTANLELEESYKLIPQKWSLCNAHKLKDNGDFKSKIGTNPTVRRDKYNH